MPVLKCLQVISVATYVRTKIAIVVQTRVSSKRFRGEVRLQMRHQMTPVI